jgi:hypothetical protein
MGDTLVLKRLEKTKFLFFFLKMNFFFSNLKIKIKKWFW